jgi:hypothetical protein
MILVKLVAVPTGLAVAIRAKDPTPDAIVAKAPQILDSAIWLDDDVELFIDPVGDGVEWYQFAVSASGSRAELYHIERGNTQRQFNPLWQSAAQRTADGYVVEMLIPWHAFRMRQPTAGAPWRFQVARQRMAGPPGGLQQINSTLFPSDRYARPADWGALVVPALPEGVGVIPETPICTVARAGADFAVTAKVPLRHAGATALAGTMTMQIDAATVSTPVTIAPGAAERVQLPAITLPALGAHLAVVTLRDAAGQTVAEDRFPLALAYEPIRIDFSHPVYRDTIYATDGGKDIVATVLVDEPGSGSVVWRLKSGNLDLAQGELRLIDRKAELRIPVGGLPDGALTLRLDALTAADAQVAATHERLLVKAPAAPAIEARIDAGGMLTINGVRRMMRGFYGNFILSLIHI